MHPRLLALLVAAAAVAACTPCTITDTPRGGTPSDTSGGHDTTVVQRATLNVHIAIDDTSDARIAATAGVSVAGLTVTVTRPASSEAPRTGTTDAQGNVQFTHLVPSSYQVTVERPLTASELALLAPEDREASIFAGGTSLYVAPPTAASYVGVVAARRGSLIISELYYHSASIDNCGGCGSFGQYAEFYNNGDTTVYLDGMLLFRTNGATHSSWPDWPCSLADAERLDPTGVWVHLIERFPGSGRDYPVRPGEAKVWAMDAVDLSGLGLLDLSRANFESVASAADPDNPAVANMIRMTTFAYGIHGPSLPGLGLLGLARPVARDTTELERVMLRFNSVDYPVFRIPRSAIVDVVGMRSTPEREVGTGAYRSGYRVCDPFTLPVWDRAEARLVDFYDPSAISRRSLGFTSDGREILQRTHNSARDFVLANPLLRSLRK